MQTIGWILVVAGVLCLLQFAAMRRGAKRADTQALHDDLDGRSAKWIVISVFSLSIGGILILLWS